MNAIAEADHAEPDHDPIGRNPFLQLVGLKAAEAADGHSRYTLDVRHEVSNIHHAAHGGVIMTVLDSAMASAAVSKSGFTTAVVTLDMSISFLRPGTGRLTIVGRRIGGGATVSFCEAEVIDEKGEVVAKAIGSFKHRKKKMEQAAAAHPG